MNDLIDFVRRDDIPVLAQAAITHAQFENIHPFPDGNGRTGRALLHAQLRHAGLTRNVLVPVSAGLLVDVGAYVDALARYRGGEVLPIVTRVAEAVFPALANARELVTDVTEARSRWNEVIGARRGAAAWRLADLLTTHAVVDAPFVAGQLGVTAANAQIAIDRLVSDGVLAQIGTGSRSRAWQAVEVIAAMERFADRAGRRMSA